MSQQAERTTQAQTVSRKKILDNNAALPYYSDERTRREVRLVVDSLWKLHSENPRKAHEAAIRMRSILLNM
jgi:hypothetical protein